MHFLLKFKNATSRQIATTVIIYMLVLNYPCAVFSKVLTNPYQMRLNHGYRPVESQQLSNHKLEDNFYDYYEDTSFEDLVRQNVGDEEYDDGEVRFITEDDVEESYHDAEDFLFHQRQIASKIENENSQCPDVPHGGFSEFPSHTLCEAKRCNYDTDCLDFGYKSSSILGQKKESSHLFICCFNGCLKTCLRVDPPKVFDWVEESDDIAPILQNPTGYNSTVLENGVNGPLLRKSLHFPFSNDGHDAEKVILPGGCSITQKQMDDLRLFQRYEHVETCDCVNGEVVCQINRRVAYKSSMFSS